MSRRHYIDNAPVPTFGPNLSTDTTFTLSSAAGLPTSFPFTVTLGLGTAAQENVLVTNISGTTATVTRNWDGLGAFSHPAGETFTHTSVAADYDEANAHVNASTGVHGVVGAVVGTTDTQTLSNKTFSGLALLADSGVVGVTVTGDNTGDLADFKNGSSTVAKIDKSGNLTAQAVATTGVTNSGANAVTGNETVGGTLGVTGNTTLSGTLTAGASTLASAAITGNATVGGTLSATGVTTEGTADVTTLAVSGTATVGSTLGVTGAVTGASFTGRHVANQFTNEAARDSALTSPAAGEIISLTAPTGGVAGVFREEIYNGAAWVAASSSGLGRVATATFSSDLTSSGTSEVVGYSQAVPTVSGRIYRVLFNGTLNAGTAANQAEVRCRFSTSTVTTSSTQAGVSQILAQSVVGSSGRTSVCWFFEFAATTTGTTNVAIGVLTGTGSGNTTIVGSIFATTVSVDCIV